MRKKTAPQTRKASFSTQPGLIAQGKTAQQSARTKSTVDNRSHRTTLQICCRRLLTSNTGVDRIEVPAGVQTHIL
jgi:hypothetical protein